MLHMISALFWDITQRIILMLPTFRDKLSVPSSKVKQSKTTEAPDLCCVKPRNGQISQHDHVEYLSNA